MHRAHRTTARERFAAIYHAEKKLTLGGEGCELTPAGLSECINDVEELTGIAKALVAQPPCKSDHACCNSFYQRIGEDLRCRSAGCDSCGCAGNICGD